MPELESYVALPVRHQRDKAGLIQGFEFTFELFWKTFQKSAPEAGLERLLRDYMPAFRAALQRLRATGGAGSHPAPPLEPGER